MNNPIARVAVAVRNLACKDLLAYIAELEEEKSRAWMPDIKELKMKASVEEGFEGQVLMDNCGPWHTYLEVAVSTFFDNQGGVNYLSQSIVTSEDPPRRFEATIQRVSLGTETPADQAIRYRRELAALKADLAGEPVAGSAPRRFWASWWTQAELLQDSESFQSFWSGSRGDDGANSLCALFDAPSAADVRALVTSDYPDAEFRFVSVRDPGWTPGDRFPGATAYRIGGDKP